MIEHEKDYFIGYLFGLISGLYLARHVLWG